MLETSVSRGARASKPVKRTGKTRLALAEHYRQKNLECARIIAADPERYQGIVAEWAHSVLSSAEGIRPAWRMVA